MKIKQCLPFLFLVFCYVSCDTDPIVDPKPEVIEENESEPEEETTADPAEELSAAREIAITSITCDGSKIWKIETAFLNNENGSFDISNNFNVQDDEFEFSNATLTGKTEFEGTFIWRQNDSVPLLSTSAEAAKQDFYILPVTYSFDFEEGSGTTITTAGDQFLFSLDETGKLIGTMTFDMGVTMEVVLAEKLESDYKQIPLEPLIFAESFTFESNSVDSGAVGMAGSLADNSFFIALREAQVNGVFVNAERVLRFDLATGITTESIYENPDFVTKQVIPHNNKLLVVGGQRVNTYGLDLSGTPTSSPDYASSLGLNYLGLTRFGTARANGNIFIIGGDLDNPAVDIFSYNITSETTTSFTTLPEARFGARGEIVGSKLYIFGGTETFSTPPAKNTILIYDFNTQDFITENMPVAVDVTYTGKIENLIYVAGRIDSQEDGIANREPFLGVYDARTGIFTQLESNLTSPDLETIHSMAVFDSKLFILYGQQEEQEEGTSQIWSVLSADI